jgi:hypothetical protein
VLLICLQLICAGGFTVTTSELSPLDGSSALRYSEWQRPYQAALLEVDRRKLAKRVADAEAAIFKRLQQLCDIQGGNGERELIEGAICALRVLKQECLNFPDWESGRSQGDAA